MLKPWKNIMKTNTFGLIFLISLIASCGREGKDRIEGYQTFLGGTQGIENGVFMFNQQIGTLLDELLLDKYDTISIYNSYISEMEALL
jgi:hypothetical protein